MNDFVLSTLSSVAVFSVNLSHLRFRKIPLYSWGTTIAMIHVAAGFVSILLIPCVFVVISVVIEIANAVMTKEHRASLDERFDKEIVEAEARTEAAQADYEKYHCLVTFTIEHDLQYRDCLKRLEDAGIWHFVRGGLITSILVKPVDIERAERVLGLGDPDGQEHEDQA